jgi:L-aminopeptidase/D-esterase-like protein
MATGAHDQRQQAHAMIDLLSADQVSAFVRLVTAMLNPVDRAIANASFEDEEISDEENRAVAASKAWLAEHPGEGSTLEELMAEFELSSETLDRQEKQRGVA